MLLNLGDGLERDLDMPQTKESFIKGRSTAFLLKCLRNCYVYDYDYSCEDYDHKISDKNNTINIGDRTFDCIVTVEELKNELAKRPHLNTKGRRKKK